jgi:hypothetical protein
MYPLMTGYFIFCKHGEMYLNKGDKLNNNYFTFFVSNYVTNIIL